MSITLLGNDSSSKQVFAHGFLKGLASPLMLFAANRSLLTLPELPPLPAIEPVRVPTSHTTMTDLQRLACDFHVALRRYDQEESRRATLSPAAD